MSSDSPEIRQIGATIQYFLNDTLGCSGHTSVHRGKFKKESSWIPCAVKYVLTENNDIKEYIKREINNLNKIQHNNVVKIYGTEEYENGRYIAIALELFEGSMKQSVEPVDIREKEFSRTCSEYLLNISSRYEILHQISSGLAYLHQEKIIHRDLKPPNILFRVKDCIHAVITDFGLSKFIEDDRSIFTRSMDVGTPGWKAPELDPMKEENQNMNPSADIFAFGLVSYYFLTKGLHPFDEENSQTLLVKKRSYIQQKNINDRTKFEEKIAQIKPHDISNNKVFELIMTMLSWKPEDRPKAIYLANFPWSDLTDMNAESNAEKGSQEHISRSINNWYTYILIDGRKVNSQEDYCFEKLMAAIFYIDCSEYTEAHERGKPYQFKEVIRQAHLAYSLHQSQIVKDQNKRDSVRICEIWNKNKPVYMLKIADFVSKEYALYIQCALYETINLHHDLTNERGEVVSSNVQNEPNKLEGDILLKKIYNNMPLFSATILTEKSVGKFIKRNLNRYKEMPKLSLICPLCKVAFLKRSQLSEHFMKTQCFQWLCKICQKSQTSSYYEYKKHLYDEKLGNVEQIFDIYVSNSYRDIFQKSLTVDATYLKNLSQKLDKQKLPFGYTYIYLLLDDRQLTNAEQRFEDFLSSIFYVECLPDSILPFGLIQKAIIRGNYDTNQNKEENFVLERIEKIFNEDSNVIVLKLDDNLLPKDASMVAASIIEALGIELLENFNTYSYEGTPLEELGENDRIKCAFSHLFHSFCYFQENMLKINKTDAARIATLKINYENVLSDDESDYSDSE